MKYSDYFKILNKINYGISKVTCLINGITACRQYIRRINYLFYKVNPSTKWEFIKQDNEKVLWVHICIDNLKGISISINKWWKTKYPSYKIRIVSKTEFEKIKKLNQS